MRITRYATGAASILAALVLLVGCGGDDSDELSTDVGPTDRIEYNHLHDGQGIRELKLTYRGHPLTCLDQKRGGSNDAVGGITCDWVEYHEKYGFER